MVQAALLPSADECPQSSFLDVQPPAGSVKKWTRQEVDEKGQRGGKKEKKKNKNREKMKRWNEREGQKEEKMKERKKQEGGEMESGRKNQIMRCEKK